MDSNFYEQLTENPNTLYEEKFTKEIQNILHEKLIAKNEYILALRLHLFTQNPKPMKPIKKFNYLDPYVMA